MLLIGSVPQRPPFYNSREDPKVEIVEMFALTNEAAKRRRAGRAIHIANDLRVALVMWKLEATAADHGNGLQSSHPM